MAGLPRLSERAPDFSAKAIHGEWKLAGSRGQWLALLPRPADFTPVCTTECIAFVRMHPAFRKPGVGLLCRSIDSKCAHITRARALKDKLGCEITFPLI